MPFYHLTTKGNVVKCKSPCTLKHEHYLGSYEAAIKYFGVDEEEPQGWGKLENIVLYHQTSGFTVPKLTNELFDILVQAQSEHKYWAAPNKREERAMEVIEKSRKAGFIMDELILKTLRNSDRKASKDRIYAYEKWMKSG